MTEAITHIATVGGFIAVAVLAVDVVARIVAWWQKRRRYKSMVALVRDGEELGLYDDQHTRCPSPDSSVTDIKGGFSYPPGDRISGSTSLDSSGVVLAPVHPARAAHDALSAPGRFSFPIAPACRLTSTPPTLPAEEFPFPRAETDPPVIDGHTVSPRGRSYTLSPASVAALAESLNIAEGH